MKSRGCKKYHSIVKAVCLPFFVLRTVAAWAVFALFLLSSSVHASGTCTDSQYPHACYDSAGYLDACCPVEYSNCCADKNGKTAGCCAEGGTCQLDDFGNFDICCSPDYPLYALNNYGDPSCCPAGSPVACLDENGNSWCCPAQTPYCGGFSECNPEPDPSFASYLAAVNIRGEASEQTESSGTLPCTNFSENARPGSSVNTLFRKIMLMRAPDWLLQQYDPALVVKTKAEICKKKNLKLWKANSYSLNEQKVFWVLDDLQQNPPAYRQITAAMLRSGAHSHIFVDTALALSDSVLDLYATEFEIMFNLVSSNFGTYVDRDGSGKVAVLIYKVNDSGSTFQFSGFFDGTDYYADADTLREWGKHSNEMDLIYVRGNAPADWDTSYDYNACCLTTLVHEFQHMVNFGQTYWNFNGEPGESDTWINEMMSTAAETVYFKEKLKNDPSFTDPTMIGDGYVYQYVEYYNQDGDGKIRNGHGLAYWDYYGDPLPNYSLAYLFGQYLAIHSANGSAVFKLILDEMIADNIRDYRAVEAAAAQTITGIGSWDELLKYWAIANFANTPGGLYGYRNAFALTPHSPTGSRVDVHNGGIVYRKTEGAWSTPDDAGPDMRFYGFTAAGLAVSTTTTTTAGITPCPATLLLGESSEELHHIRRFQNNILPKTERGEKLTALYYQYSHELFSMFTGDNELRTAVHNLLLDLMPYLTGALQGDSMVMGKSTRGNTNIVFDKILSLSGPEMRKTVLELKRDFNEGKLFRQMQINISFEGR